MQQTGKVFYLELDGKGKMPVLHFGMTGMLQVALLVVSDTVALLKPGRKVKGQLATYYKETPRKASTDWPPRFMKVCVPFLYSIDAYRVINSSSSFISSIRRRET